MNIYIIAAFVLGCLLGYLVFYYRFADRTIVTELRKALADNQDRSKQLDYERAELKEQNTILRAKVQELLGSNSDFSQIVGELSRYYYNIKKGAEQAEALMEFLRKPDPTIEQKLAKYTQAASLHQKVGATEPKAQFF